MQKLGPAAVRGYCHDLALAAAEKIARAWRQPLAGLAAMHGSMMAIRLPDSWQRRGATREIARKIQSDFMDRHRIAVAIMPIDEALWARISAQIYNSPEDYERLMKAALD